MSSGCPRPLAAHPGDRSFSPSGEGGYFVRGDADQNGSIEITDAIFTLGYLFLGTEDPYCLDALDTDDNGQILLNDAVAGLNFLFSGSFKMPAPFPDEGVDPTADDLTCDNGRFTLIRREIFTTSCATSFCHSSADAAGGLVLEGDIAYSQVYLLPAANAAARAAGLLRVRPGSPELSYLYKKMTGQVPPEQTVHVPDMATLVSASDLALVEHWIADGAPPSTTRDITLPLPARGEQIVIPPFPVQELGAGIGEVQRNYYFKLKSTQTIWVNRVELLTPPGIDHWNLFSWQQGPSPYVDGQYEDFFPLVSFRDWNLKASSEVGRLDWKLPPGVAIQFAPQQQTASQIHFVNVPAHPSPVGGSAAINLHTIEVDPRDPPQSMGALMIQNSNIQVLPQSTSNWDFGVTFSRLNHSVPVKLASLGGHYHWRGKRFEVRVWEDNPIANADGSPAAGEFDRMGPERTIYFSDNFEEPPLIEFGEDGPDIPAGGGVIFRTTYENSSGELLCFGPHAEYEEHANLFVYYYPGAPLRSGFLWYPPECLGQGCSVPCG